MRFSTKMVISAVIAIVGYTAALFAVEVNNPAAQIPDALTVAWFAFWTVEIVSLASIRRSKIKNKYEVEVDND